MTNNEQARKYDIIRFKYSGKDQVIWRGLTLEQAREWCNSELTQKVKKDGEVVWFDGFTSNNETTQMPKYQLPYVSPEKILS